MRTPLVCFSPKEGVHQVRYRREASFREHQATKREDAGRMTRILLLSKQRARRNGSWYRLGRLDRTLYGLVLRLRVKFRSPLLLRFLVGVLKRLRETGDVTYRANQHGLRIAWAFSGAAVAWGNEAAREWRNDRDFALFLGLVFQRGSGQ